MADFSLNTLFVVPKDVTIANSGSTQDLTAGKVGFFKSDYTVATAANIAASPYFYVAQGRENTYLQGSKRSDKISGNPSIALTGNAQTISPNGKSNVTEFYKVTGCATPVTQVTDVDGWNVRCGDVVTLTLRAHSSYLDTLYFNGFTRSVTVQAPCCDCGADPCDTVDVPALIDAFIAKLEQQAPGINPDNISLNNFYQFQRIGDDDDAILRISGKPLTVYGQPCDVAAFPYEFDRMWFRTFVYSGPATTADFIVADNCNIVANAEVVQRANYARGLAAEIIQLEKNFYSYQAGYLKHLYRMVGYNENFESYVVDGEIYDTYYIKFNEYDRSAYQWGDYIQQDSQVIIAAVSGSTESTLINTILTAALGTIVDGAGTCITTTSTTTQGFTTTTTSSTLIP
jgi:hypothetical protein